jgi:hypothetical protein
MHFYSCKIKGLSRSNQWSGGMRPLVPEARPDFWLASGFLISNRIHRVVVFVNRYVAGNLL